MSHRFLSFRIRQIFALTGLLLMLSTTLMAPSYTYTATTSIAEEPTPTPPPTNGWDDPVGG